MSLEIDLQKLELLRTALPKGLSAGDGGLTQPRSISTPVASFPQFTSKVSESKLYNPTLDQNTLPSEVSDQAFIDLPSHPWKIILRSNEETFEYKIELNSALYSGLGNFTNIAITGLDFWAPASVGYLYLFGIVENGICTEASIQGPEEIPSDRIDFVGDEQNSFSTILGYIYDDENGNFFVKQDAFHNFTLLDVCVNGRPAIYPLAT